MDLIDDKAEKPILVYSCGLRSRGCLYRCSGLQAVDRKHLPSHICVKPPSNQWSWRLYPDGLTSSQSPPKPLLKLPGGSFHSLLLVGIQHKSDFRQEQNTPHPEMWDDPLQFKEDEKGLSTKLEWCWAWKNAECGWMGELLGSLLFVFWGPSQPCQGCSWGPSRKSRMAGVLESREECISRFAVLPWVLWIYFKHSRWLITPFC